jgi:3'(2'),5'-bisphosphate nucleotidase
MNLEQEIRVALELARKAGVIIRKHYESGIGHEMKENKTPVTRADFESNELILKGLAAAFPNDGIVSEEASAINSSARRVWYVDPLDGTRGFVERTGNFAVHIALAIGGKPVLGVVHHPMKQLTYLGIPGEGAFRLFPDGRKEKIVMSASLPGLVASIDRKKDWEKYILFFEKLGVTGRLVSGSEGLRVMKIVEGEAHFRIADQAANSWDVCAPHAVLLAAGGVCAFAAIEKPVTYHGQAGMDGILVYARDEKLLSRVREKYRMFF